MTHVFQRRKLLLCFLWFSTTLQAQDVPVTNEVNAAIRNVCAVCSQRSAQRYDPSRLQSPLDIAVICYHNSHTSLYAGKHADAYRYAQLAIAALGDSLQQPLYNNTIFLQAKINQRTGALPAAIDHYTRFLSFDKPDSILGADASVSLIRMYLAKEAWKEADRYLNTWSSYYAPFSDSLTKAGLYDSLVALFSPDRNISQPEAAIQIITSFLSARSDTGRLTALYARIADWYTQRAGHASAVVYFQKGLALAIGAGNLEKQQQFYLGLSLAEEKRADFQAALRYRKLYEETGARMLSAGGYAAQNRGQKKSQLGLWEMPRPTCVRKKSIPNA